MLCESVNIASCSMLSAPGTVRAEIPLPEQAAGLVAEARRAVFEILRGRSKRLMAIVGPCSIHNPDAALEYAERLKALRPELGDALFVIMRVYFEKPRTTLGWKGLLYDPDLNGAYDIEKGIATARKLLVKIASLGVPAATEMLDPVISAYLEDTITWAAIGARTTEAPTHRQLASGLPMAVGFKNATDGERAHGHFPDAGKPVLPCGSARRKLRTELRRGPGRGTSGTAPERASAGTDRH